VVLLDIAEATTIVGGCLPVGFFSLRCHIMVEVVDGFHRLVVRDIEGVGLACVAKVVVSGGGHFGGATT
jgi:hypothetical protein